MFDLILMLSIPSILYNVLRSSVFNLFVMSSASRFSVFLYEYYEITTPASVLVHLVVDLCAPCGLQGILHP